MSRSSPGTVMGLLLLGILLSGTPLGAQLAATFQTRVNLPEERGVYRIAFRHEILVPQLGVTEAGVIRLGGMGKASFHFSAFDVTGPDPREADRITARIELPPSAAGGTVFLSDVLTEGYSSTFVVRDSGTLVMPARLIISYAGTNVHETTLDLSRTFAVPPPVVAAPARAPVPTEEFIVPDETPVTEAPPAPERPTVTEEPPGASPSPDELPPAAPPPVAVVEEEGVEAASVPPPVTAESMVVSKPVVAEREEGAVPPPVSPAPLAPVATDRRWWWIATGAVVGMVLLALLLFGLRRRAVPAVPPAAPVAVKPTPVPEIVPAPPTQAAAAPPASPEKTSGMRITKRVTPTSSEGFHPDAVPDDFLPLSMAALWHESRVATLYMGRTVVREIDGFLRHHDPTRSAGTGPGSDSWEHNSSMPEIGGMLMGQYAEASDGYRVSVEQFVPLEARYQSVVKVDIDPLSIARDLSEAQDRHPELRVVGWFHTHPGHGLFLSPPDLKVQYNQFPAPYHFAMEIDPLSARRDTGFFTYTSSGAMNNADTRRPGTDWFSWTTLLRSASRNPTT